MDPLKRDNQGVRATNHENRIEALERRIFPQATEWAFVRLTTDYSHVGGAQILPFDNFWTSAPQMFDTIGGTGLGPNEPGNVLLRSYEFGVYIATLTVEWEDTGSAYAHSSNISATRLIDANLGALGASTATASFDMWPDPTGAGDTEVLDTGDVTIGIHSPWDYTDTQYAGWSMFTFNHSGAPVDVLRANMMVALLPSSLVEEDYVVY